MILATAVTTYTKAAWHAEGERRFGQNALTWQFVCPSCGTVQCAEDFRPYTQLGATPESACLVCIGRYKGAIGAFDSAKHKPCNYSSGGLFRISPIRIILTEGSEPIHCFAFADAALDGDR